mgnify:CR=1 FL=1
MLRSKAPILAAVCLAAAAPAQVDFGPFKYEKRATRLLTEQREAIQRYSLVTQAAGEGVLDRLEAACLEGGTSFYTSGIDPGFDQPQICAIDIAAISIAQTRHGSIFT